MRITEQGLVRHFTGASYSGDLMSQIGNKTVWWNYVGEFLGVGRENADRIIY